MILSDKDLAYAVRKYDIIQPYNPANVQPASYDFILGRRFRIMKKVIGYPEINPLVDQSATTEEILLDDGEVFRLRSNDFVLGITDEYFKIPDNLAAKIEGKSSLGRIGLVIHSTAGWIDPGFQGVITLELGNLTDRTIMLTPGMKIGQICFVELSSPCEYPYGSDKLNSKYQFSIEPNASLMHLENPANPKGPGASGGKLSDPAYASISPQDGSGSTENANPNDYLADPVES